MKQRLLSILNRLAEKALVLLVVIYVFFSVGRNVLKNYQMNQKINGLKEQIAVLDRQKAYLQNLMIYYRTDTYKELKAREELGYQKADEHVLSVPVEKEEQSLTEPNHFVTAPEAPPVIANYQKWFNYFFG